MAERAAGPHLFVSREDRPARGMRPAVVAIVASGIALAVGVGAARGIDTVSAIVLFFVVAVGLLAVRVATAAEHGKVAPARCDDCGGLISPNAPYCKHCGVPQHGGTRL